MIRKIALGLAFTASLLTGNYKAGAQGMAVNTTGAAANSSAILDASSTTQGVLVPRMTQSNRNLIATPATGLLIYQTDATPGFYFNSGTPASPVWTAVSGGAPTGSASGDLSGSYPSPTIASTAGANVVTAINGSSSVINPANEGTGSHTSSTFLRGDGSWSSPLNLTTAGTTGAATYTAGTNTLNIPNYATGGGSSGSSGFCLCGTASMNVSTSPVWQIPSGPNSAFINVDQAYEPLAVGGTIDALYVYATRQVTSSGADNTYTGNVYVNGVATSIQVSFTVTAGSASSLIGSFSDVAHTKAVSAGDLVCIQWTQSAGSSGTWGHVTTCMHIH